ncbi:polysaccharide deacetylase family protein [Streptomycetaceae bacterium NBC_01309]
MDRRGFIRAAALSVGTGAVAVAPAIAEAPDPNLPAPVSRSARPRGESGLFATRVLWQLPAERPTVALTFDDGPDPEWTPRVLDILARHRIPATFFLLGGHATDHPGLARRIADAGHEIGNHTWDHPNLTRTTPEGIEAQLERTQNALARITGQTPRLFRPPYGHIDPPGLLAAARIECDIALWTAAVRFTHADEDAGSTVHDVRPGNIVLLHDTAANCSEPLLRACERMIVSLRERGYGFSTVSGLPAA